MAIQVYSVNPCKATYHTMKRTKKYLIDALVSILVKQHITRVFLLLLSIEITLVSILVKQHITHNGHDKEVYII